jgi:predicted nucleic acid-binding protein
MFLLARSGGWPAQARLWDFLDKDALRLSDLGPREAGTMPGLMNKYRDVPMSLADASLVVLAQAIGAHRIFTLDSDFRIYKVRGRTALELLPAL